MKKHISILSTLIFLLAMLSCGPDKSKNDNNSGTGVIPEKKNDVIPGDSTVSNNPRKLKDSVEILSKGNAASKIIIMRL